MSEPVLLSRAPGPVVFGPGVVSRLVGTRYLGLVIERCDVRAAGKEIWAVLVAPEGHERVPAALPVELPAGPTEPRVMSESMEQLGLDLRFTREPESDPW